jgi:L-rhamnose isomerase
VAHALAGLVAVESRANLEQKIEDVGLLHALNRSSGAISLHIPWDIPEDASKTKQLAAQFDLRFDAVNSNTFQDQPGKNTVINLAHCNMLTNRYANRPSIIILK